MDSKTTIARIDERISALSRSILREGIDDDDREKLRDEAKRLMEARQNLVRYMQYRR